MIIVWTFVVTDIKSLKPVSNSFLYTTLCRIVDPIFTDTTILCYEVSFENESLHQFHILCTCQF